MGLCYSCRSFNDAPLQAPIAPSNIDACTGNIHGTNHGGESSRDGTDPGDCHYTSGARGFYCIYCRNSLVANGEEGPW